MLSLFLFINLFAHIIYFSYLKIQNSVYIYRLTIISLLFCFIDSIHNIILFEDLSITLFNDSLRLNTSILAQESLILFIALILLLSFRKYNFKPEFFLIIFSNIISANFLLESYNFIVLFISWELFNLSLYILIIGNGVNKQQALSASLKYFLLSAFSTAFFLLGISLIYHITGTLEFENVYLALYHNSIELPIILIIFAMIFKLGSAPLHFWAPDLYDTTPLPITAYISNIPKIVYLLLIVNLFDFIGSQYDIFIISGLLSLIIGTLGLTQQFKIKRFLAFSGITNLGYLLLIVNDLNLLMYNLIIYMIATICIFLILLYLESLYEKEIDNLQQIKGLFHLNPALALLLTISIFSIAGIPPLPGFFAKYNLLISIFDSVNYISYFIIIFTTVLAVSNYIRIIYFILFSESTLKNLSSQPSSKIVSIERRLGSAYNNKQLYRSYSTKKDMKKDLENSFKTIKQVLKDENLLSTLTVTNFNQEKISLDQPLNLILQHLKLDTFFSEQFLAVNNHTKIKLQLWLEEVSTNFEYIHDIQPNNEIKILEELDRLQFIQAVKYFKVHPILYAHISNKSLNLKLIIKEAIIALDENQSRAPSLNFKLDFIKNYIYKYIYWPWLLTQDNKLTFSQFLKFLNLNDGMLFKLAMTFLKPFYDKELLSEEVLSIGKSNYIKLAPNLAKLLKKVSIKNAYHLPMITPPLNWVPIVSNGIEINHVGGHYRVDLINFPLIRDNLHSTKVSSEFLDNMNRIQAIPLTINTLLFKNLSDRLFKLDYDNKLVLALAELFEDLVFYLPYFLDWRGRMYSKVLLSHFNGKLAKNLITPIYNKALSDQGLRSLKIYAATIFGLDYPDRLKIDWFNLNESKILAKDIDFCLESKDPLTFYNLVLHYNDYIKDPSKNFNLSINIDVNSSNILHIACLLHVPLFYNLNLEPSLNETSQTTNIYKIIKEQFVLAVKKWGNFAEFKLDKIKLMTIVIITSFAKLKDMMLIFAHQFVYNPKLNSYIYKDGKTIELSYSDLKEILTKLTDVVIKNLPYIGVLFNALTKILNLAKDLNVPISWSTGYLDIKQFYPKRSTKNIKISIKSKKSSANVLILEEPVTFDLPKNEISIISNITQSLDATHTNLIIGKTIDKGISLLTLHDSFIFHPNDKDLVRSNAAKSLVQMYSHLSIYTIIKDFQVSLINHKGLLEVKEIKKDNKILFLFVLPEEKIFISVTDLYTNKIQVTKLQKLINSKYFMK